MPVLDGNFEAFVTNLGKYNEGMLVGEWVKLPTTEEEMQKVFERIGIGKQDEFGQPYEEWFITDYECPIYGVQKMLGEYESLDKLNYLAALIDELSLSDQEKLVAIMEAGCDEVSVPFPVSWTVKMKKKQKETQDILSYHSQAAGCSDKARAKASGGRQPIEECGRTGL